MRMPSDRQPASDAAAKSAKAREHGHPKVAQIVWLDSAPAWNRIHGLRAST
jgi:hypothetical protein